MNQQFGPYRILAPLAKGGMARVYKAAVPGEDGRDRLVALKRIRREFAEDPEFLERFMDEARIASTFLHENIVRVTDFGSVDGEPFMAMELVEGVDLRAFITRHEALGRPIPIWAATYIATLIARGLEAAHCRVDGGQQPAPVIHRDISPQNVLISWDGQVKIADFGVAKAAEKVLRTRTGVILGKWRYMAPEQCRGDAVDCCADVFSAGCVIYELLVGKPLFNEEGSEQIIRSILHKTIPSVDQARADVPPLLQAICRRALSRPLEQRYKHAGELATELTRCLADTAPDSSAARLGELVRELVLPRKNSGGDHGTLALAETVESSSSRAQTAIRPRPLAELETAISPPGALLAEQETAISPPGALFAAQPTALFDPAPDFDTATKPRTGAWRPAAGRAVIIGGLGVVFGAMLGIAAHRLGEKEVNLGQVVNHRGWTLLFDHLEPRVHPRGDHLEIGLRLRCPRGEVPPLGDLLLLQRGRHLIRPQYSVRPQHSAPRGGPEEIRWRLFFEGRHTSALRLRFAPAGAPPLHLRLKP